MIRFLSQRAQRYWRRFSFLGLLSATLFFAASVTPSLIPRPYFIQGLLSGFALATGYAVGNLAELLWRFLELPWPAPRLAWHLKRLATLIAFVIFVSFTWQMTFWQNSLRDLMEMPRLQAVSSWRIAGIAVVWGALLIGTGRSLGELSHWGARRLNRFLPWRLSWLASITLVGFAVLFVVNDVLARSAVSAADRFFARWDQLIDEHVEQPGQSRLCGSPGSDIDWDSIGRMGKLFLRTGPAAGDISRWSGRPARHPIRVYVGFRSASDHDERARLALAELIRLRAFDRSVLVVATPTGTGWLDPGAVDTIEYLHGGDTAIVATQYSYLPSWMTLMVDSRRSIDAAHALFDVVYSHWKTLPRDDRPRLYLHGLSLGALGSEVSADLFTILEDPVHGAVWSGPPFPSTSWARLTRERNEGTPAWRPEFRDSAMVRFTGQENHLQPEKVWGPFRCVYIQYASDPMVFFSSDLMFQRPDWLRNPKGPDVSPHFSWLPIITCLQVAFDLPIATTVPVGHGHNYAPASYIDAWVAVTDPETASPQKIHELKRLFAGSSAE